MRWPRRSSWRAILPIPEFQTLYDELLRALRAQHFGCAIEELLVVGIHSGGVWLAERIRQDLQIEAEIGKLDISFYRDDFSRVGFHPVIKPSQIPWEIEGRHLLLIDDILYTGRTVRAALNELFDYGRPASVQLAVLVSRNGRELPIEALACGAKLTLQPGQQLKLRGPEPLHLDRVAAESGAG